MKTAECGDFERASAYLRLNSQGQQELVRKRKGRRDKGTLNELMDHLLAMLEDIEFANPVALSAEQPLGARAVNQPTPPQLVASRGDPARAAGQTLTNMGAPPPQTSDLGANLGPSPLGGGEIARVRSGMLATARGNTLNSKYITDHGEDGLDHGATHAESLCTGAVALRPAAFGSPANTKRRKKNNTTRLEHNMSRRNIITEWLPEFKGSGYDSGDYTMPKPGGKGVADRTPTTDSVGQYDTDTTKIGQEWPRDHNDTAAMCDVDEDGVEHEPQGTHESTHGEPTDGIQKKVGHNWPNQPKLSGQGVAEPFEGDRWSDGGTLKGGRGPGSDTWTHTDGPGMPGDGPITGTSGPQLGQPANESWSPTNMARLMGQDANLQAVFDSYAQTASAVCLEDFQALCSAHGIDHILDESSLLTLMKNNQDFVFYEGSDANGPYWVGEAVTEDCCEKCGCAICECGASCNTTARRKRKKPKMESRLPSRRTINETQVRSPEEEAGLFTDEGPGLSDEDSDFGGPSPLYAGDPHIGGGVHGIDDSHTNMETGELEGSAYDDAAANPMMEPGLDGPGGMQEMECPGCGYAGAEWECPECGAEMMDPMGDEFTDESFADVPQALSAEVGERTGLAPTMSDDDYDPDVAAKHRDDAEFFDDNPMEARTIKTGPRLLEGLRNFMGSARSLLEGNPQASRKNLAEALNHSWRCYVGPVDVGSCPTKVRNTISGLMARFPGFNPMLENEAMERPDGTSLGGGDGPSIELPKRPSKMETKSEKSLLGKSQTNDLAGTPTIPGTGKGMHESHDRAQQIANHNMQKLARHIRTQLAEGARGLQKNTYDVCFSILVTEANKLPDFLKDKKKKGKKPAPPKKSKKRTDKRDSLAEALADAEEMLQMHNAKDVTFEATYLGPQGQIALKQNIPLFTIAPRGPIVGESKALFRFKRHAEAFAEALAEENVASRIMSHNWGSAVQARTNYAVAARAFATIAESL